jgi:hypothetical protein
MPTLNPRLTVTLKPTTAAQLRKLSQLTGSSQSALIAELLEGSEDVFSRLITLIQAATDAKASLTAEMVGTMEAAQAKLEGQMGLALDTWDTAAAPLLNEAEAIVRRARKRDGGGMRAARPAPARAAAPTPLSNRGVRSTSKTRKSPVKAGGK